MSEKFESAQVAEENSQLHSREYSKEICVPYNGDSFCNALSTVLPIPVAARSKMLVYGSSPAEIVGSNPTGGMDICLL